MANISGPNEKALHDPSNNHNSQNILPMDPEDYFDDSESLALDESIAIESIAMMSSSMQSMQMQSAEDENSGEQISCTFVHEGQSSRIYRLEDPLKRHGRDSKFVTMKVLNDQLPDAKDVSRIDNEYNALKHLTKCECQATRDAFEYNSRNGAIAIYLDWLEGITLREWIDNLESSRASSDSEKRDNEDLKKILLVARDISRILSDMHGAGVTHNNIMPEHIIINAERNDTVKFIGLGSASILTERVNSCPSSEKRNDLISLGYIFFEMISGKSYLYRQCEDHAIIDNDCKSGMEKNSNSRGAGKEGENNSSKLYISQNEVYSILFDKIPVCLLKIIMKLIEGKMITQRYESAHDVFEELDKIITDSRALVVNEKKKSSLGQLHSHPQKLYGRDNHLKILLHACKRMGSRRSSGTILVSGQSGTGKSALVHHVGQILIKMGICFTSGKFDEFQHAEPFSAIIDAFNGYFDGIMQSGQEGVTRVKDAILEAMGSNVSVLTNVFPSLCQIVGNHDTDPVQVGLVESQNRFKYFFELMITTIATPSYPLVLFLDDLQWADESSLDLMKAVITQRQGKCFLFVGAYRHNEVSNINRIGVFLEDVAKKRISITKIQVDNIGREDLNDLISDSICMPKHETKSLADIVYRKTSGNVLFVTQFLQTIYREGLLQFSLDSELWEWDNVAMETKVVSDDVVKLLASKILKLPLNTQHVLKILSCVGCSCPESILRLLIDEKLQGHSETSREYVVGEHSVLSALEVALHEGLVNKKGALYEFVHDQIQSSAYSLIPENERDQMHLEIGNLIIKKVPADQGDNVIFVAADQLNRGKSCMNEQMKEVAVELNLRAGRKAMSMGTFPIAASYLKEGISVLCEGHWEKTYDLSLQLHNLFAEAELCNGHFQEVGKVTGTIIQHARSFQDKHDAFYSIVKAFGCQNKPNEAIELSFSVLADLDETIPSSLPHQNEIRADLIKSIHSFVVMDDAQFLSLNEMKNETKLAAMKFFYAMIPLCYFAKQEYLLYVVSRMMDVTMTYGVCKESCNAIAMCSFILGGPTGDWNASYRLGELALLLLEKLQVKEYTSAAYIAVYCAKTWIDGIKSTTIPHYRGYEIGMQTGDIESAMRNLMCYAQKRFHGGAELPIFEKETRVFCELMLETGQETTRQSILPYRQAALNLMGRSENALELTGDDIIEQTFLALCMQKNQEKLIITVHHLKTMLAYILGEYDLAALAISKRIELEKNMSKKVEVYGSISFYTCLTYLALAHKTKEKKFVTYISKEMETIKKIAEPAECGTQHRLLLVEAEFAYLMENMDKASEKYSAAIAAAEMSGNIQERAMLYERAGDFFLLQDSAKATFYFGQANELYQRWGAQRKVHHLCKRIPL